MEIILYSTNCPMCRVLESKLNQKGVKYTICSDTDIMESKKFLSVPQLEIDGNIYNFSEALHWINNYKG